MKTTAEKNAWVNMQFRSTDQKQWTCSDGWVDLDKSNMGLWSECVFVEYRAKPEPEPAEAREWWIIPTRSFIGHVLPPEANNAAWCEPGPECPQEGVWPRLAIHVREVLPGADAELEALRAERDRLLDALKFKAEIKQAMDAQMKELHGHISNIRQILNLVRA